VIPLSQTELESPKTAAELHPWVMSKFDEFAATEEGKQAIRLTQGLAKILVEESFPLGLFANHYFDASPKVVLVQVIGSQPYDAWITDERENPSSLQYVEVTQAHEGENDYLRMVALQQNGHVSVLGSVRKEGSKRRGLKVEAENEAKCHSEVIAEQLRRIQAAVERKSGKDYPEHTGLVIAIEDFIAFRTPEDVAQLEALARHELIPRLSQFELVSFVGSSGNSHLTFRVGDAAI